MKTWHWIAIGVGVLIVTSQGNRLIVMSDLKKIRLGKNFTLDEFVKTSTGLDNIPGQKEIDNLRLLVEHILQPLRDAVGLPIIINSGYRSPDVNANVVGSSATSQHMKGEAADIQVKGMTNDQIVETIRRLRLPYDQLIDEQRGSSFWVHVSYSTTAMPRLMWMTRRDPGPGEKEYNLVKYGFA